MVRIAGLDISDNKKIDIALTKLFGIGRSNVYNLIKKAGLEATKKAGKLSEEEVNRIQKILDKDYLVEGDLKVQISENIKRLREIGSYRGLRHTRNLPVRGQRTRSNARTKRGKRQTVGALRKDVRAKLDKPQASKESA